MISIFSRSLKAPIVTLDEMAVGEARTATVNFNNAADKLGTTVSSATWTVENDSEIVAVGSAALTSGVATATITANSDGPGCCMLTVKATMASGAIAKERIKIEVVEVDC